MKLIVALGNPDKQYAHTRHNIGFAVVDSYARKIGATFAPKPKFHADIAEIAGEEKILLVKPTTYYNLIGESVRALSDFYKIAPVDTLLVHDDLALPLGTIRTRIGGSDAGNNGVKSVNQHVGEATARLRIGTWSEHRDSIDDATFVLSKFTPAELETLTAITPKITAVIELFIRGDFAVTTHR